MKKSFVKFAWEVDRYIYKDADTQEMCILGCFLMSDVGCRKSRFKKWAAEEASQFYGGNITDLEREGNFIIVTEPYLAVENSGPFLKVPKQEFIRLLDEWEKICKEKPQEVLITFDGERFTIETKQ